MIKFSTEPYKVLIFTDKWHIAEKEGGSFNFNKCKVELAEGNGGIKVYLTATEPVRGICLRYNGSFNENVRVLGDHWERAYADLGFMTLRPERQLPWYFLANTGYKTDGYGVKTGPNAFCSFFASFDGIDMIADVRSGGVGVNLKGRKLEVCTLISREGKENESAFQAGRAFCKMMCDNPRLPKKPVYGSNNWYYAMGDITNASVLADAKFIADLTKGLENRPFMVIDDGWQIKHSSGWGGYNGGPWDKGNEDFPDMGELAANISANDVIPGIWMRPLHYRGEEYDKLGGRLRDSDVLDPTLDASKELITKEIKCITNWGYKLIKHDFSSVDITGRWGMGMIKDGITGGDWKFSDDSRTTAEIVLDLYRLIRDAAGDDTYIIGCNTFSHLSAGLFELQRTGDDTSGHDWVRTRRYGINTVAFRGIQHNAFYAADGDCIGHTGNIPWELNKMWLELLAKSGTPLFVAPDPKKVNAEQFEDLRRALEISSKPQPIGEPLDWLYNDCPARWRFGDEERTFNWTDYAHHEMNL